MLCTLGCVYVHMCVCDICMCVRHALCLQIVAVEQEKQRVKQQTRVKSAKQLAGQMNDDAISCDADVT